MSASGSPPSGTPAGRPWLARVVDRGVVIAAAAGLVVGLAAGALAFWVGSSRGLDSIELARLIELGSTFFALALVVGAGVTALWRDDVRMAALLLAILLGAWLGNQASFYLVPGNSTDGTMAVTLGTSDANGRGLSRGVATCRWDRPSGVVRSVESRQPISIVPFVTATVRIELDRAAGSSTLSYELIAPFSTTPVLRLHGTGRPQLDAVGRTGSLGAQPLVREPIGSVEGMEDAVAVLEEALAEIGSDRGRAEWECPQLP